MCVSVSCGCCCCDDDRWWIDWLKMFVNIFCNVNMCRVLMNSILNIHTPQQQQQARKTNHYDVCIWSSVYDVDFQSAKNNA